MPSAPFAGGGTSLHAPHLAMTQVALGPLAAPSPAPSPVPLAVLAHAVDESRPILPPRPTGRLDAAPDRSAWRTWPVIVIVLALIAIATAVVLMMWPPPSTATADPRLGPTPAPERMDTNPLPQGPRGQLTPPGASPDPWRDPGAVPRQPAPPPSDPFADPDDPSAIDPDDLLRDPFANPRGGRGGGGGLGGNPFGSMGAGNALVFSMVKHACDRIKSCPGSGASTMTSMCVMLEQSFGQVPPPPASCVAARRCLAQIDRLDLCGGTSSDPFASGGLADITTLLSTAQDCLDAARC